MDRGLPAESNTARPEPSSAAAASPSPRSPLVAVGRQPLRPCCAARYPGYADTRTMTSCPTTSLAPPLCRHRQTNLPQYNSPTFSSKRRFTDFVFLHDHLSKDFPACVVPPIPGKHRLGESTGLLTTDIACRVVCSGQNMLTRPLHAVHSTQRPNMQSTSRATGSDQSLWKSAVKSEQVSSTSLQGLQCLCLTTMASQTSLGTTSLNRFLQRLTRHPTLARSTLLQDFLESTEWVGANCSECLEGERERARIGVQSHFRCTVTPRCHGLPRLSSCLL